MTRRRYQEGCLFKRGRVGRKVWVARWREDTIGPDGAIERTMRSKVLGRVDDIPTTREARNRLNSLLRPTNEGLRRPQATLTFGEFASKWEEAILPTYPASTRYFYWKILHKHLVPRFAPDRLCDIHAPDVQIFLNQKAERYAPAVVRHIRSTLSRTYSSAREWGYIDRNPALGVRLPPKRAVWPKVTFEPSQVQKIFERLEEPFRTVVLLAAVTGMRASEVFGLKWSDIDFDRRLLHVRRTFYRGNFGQPKTESSARAIPISPGLLDALNCHKQRGRRSPLDLVFSNGAGNPYEPGTLLGRVLYPALAAAGLPKAGWRVFRRSVATALSEMREPVRTTQLVLGHSSPVTTLAFYVQSAEESQRRAIAKLEEVMFPSCSQVGGNGS
jgi:integrase